MRILKKSFIAVFAAVAAACLALAVFLQADFARAGVFTLENSGGANAFSLMEAEYGKEDKFAFAADISVKRGRAGGLVFGASEGNYWVFSFDRTQNRVKLSHFSGNEESVLSDDYFIGNDKMTDGEKELVSPKVAAIETVNLKVIVTPEEDGVYAEFYADGIRRFAFDEEGGDVTLNLDETAAGLTYEGGRIGYYCSEAKIEVSEVYYGVSDYSYYTELYRQQYHYSQFAHWNNDPNGLVYYNGYYHIYYQHNPYGDVWGDMYWGHARSKDLVHWENLPICLFPDGAQDGWGAAAGYMWSGTAMVYHSGASADLDELGWFPNGDGTGLLGFYTRHMDKNGVTQDQMIMSSDDGGLTWTKRKKIPQSIILEQYSDPAGLADCRDPKVFPLDGYGWGMVVTGMGSNNIWFLKSENLLDWTYAGGFKAQAPECPDLITIKADDNKDYTVMTFTSRRYLVGQISYDTASGKIVFIDYKGSNVSNLALNNIPFKTMDYGPDSYASQTFYIDDEESEYYGKTLVLNWFSGVPGADVSADSGALASARKRWNGGGFTIPAELGLKKETDGSFTLTQIPIVKTAEGFKDIKTEAYSGDNENISDQTENVLKDIKGNCFELEATITNPQSVAVYFRIGVGGGEYTEIGWNSTDGYYVDRTHTGSGGMTLDKYHNKFISGQKGKTGEQTFYILSDNGSVEAFCDGFKVPFYVLTFSSPYADGLSFTAGGEVTASITVNKISSVWREDGVAVNVINTDADSVLLDTSLTTQTEIFAHALNGESLSWRIASGSDFIELEQTAHGATVKSIAKGSAEIEISAGEAKKLIPVTVTAGSPETDFTYKPESVTAGRWYMTDGAILGVQPSGDGWIFADESADDFIYSASFDLDGAAAALVFRANENLTKYLVLTYDINAPVVKLWGPGINGNIGEKAVERTNKITLTAVAAGRKVTVFFNGSFAFSCNLPDGAPLSGRFGLNVCAAEVSFSSVTMVRNSVGEAYACEGGALSLGFPEIPVRSIYNRTAYNTEINRAFYKTENGKLVISKDYFATLKASGEYVLAIAGEQFSYGIKINVAEVPEPEFAAVSITKGANAVINLGGLEINKVSVNGEELPAEGYKIVNGVLTVFADRLGEGENVISFADKSVTVTVKAAALGSVAPVAQDINLALVISLPITGAVLIGAAVALTVILLRKRRTANAATPEEPEEGVKSGETEQLKEEEIKDGNDH